MAINPYESPTESEWLQNGFDSDCLPFELSVRQSWKVYGFVLLLISLVNVTIAVVSMVIFQRLSIVMTAVVPLSAIITAWAGLRAMLSKVTITTDGIRTNQFGKEIQYSEIRYWSTGAYSNVVLTLKSGRKHLVFGTSRSKTRNEIIGDALKHFGVAERSGDIAG